MEPYLEGSSLNKRIWNMNIIKGTISQSFQKEADPESLYWNFGQKADESVKLQIEQLLYYIIKMVRNTEERRNGYLLTLKYLFCYAENSGLQNILRMDKTQEKEFVSLLRKLAGG